MADAADQRSSALDSEEYPEDVPEAETSDGQISGAAGKVNFVRKATGGAEFSLARGESFIVPKDAFFCWLMAGDYVSLVYHRGQSPVTLDFPVLVLPEAGERAVLDYLTDCAKGQRKVADAVLKKLKPRFDEAKHRTLFELVCEWSLPKFQRRLQELFPSDRARVPESRASAQPSAEQAALILRRWYRAQTLRRVYNLQVTKRELKDSYLDPLRLFAVCGRNPFLVPSLPAVKARLICAMLGLDVTPEMEAMGEALRTIREQLAEHGNFAVPRAALVERCPAFPGVAEALAAEGAIVNLAFERPLVCLAGVHRLLRSAAKRLRHRAPAEDIAAQAAAAAPLPPPLPVARWNDGELSAGQRAAVAEALSSRLFWVSGEAGTGKTRVIAELAFQIRARRQTFRVAVFTGKATVRVRETFAQAGLALAEGEVTTIHRMIFGGCAPSDYLIFDEASMVSTLLFHRLGKKLEWVRAASKIFVGDPNQLPPIDRGRLFHQVLASDAPGRALTTNYRFGGEGAGIARFAAWVLAAKAAARAGEAIPPRPQNLEGVEIFAGAIQAAKNLITRLVREEGCRPSNFKVLCPYRKETAELNLHLRALFGREGSNPKRPASGPGAFEVGQRVIMCYNDYKALVFNGEEGIVTSVKLPGETRESVLSVNFTPEAAPISRCPAKSSRNAKKRAFVAAAPSEVVPAEDPFAEGRLVPAAPPEDPRDGEAPPPDESAEEELKIVEFFDVPPRKYVGDDADEDEIAHAAEEKASVYELELASALTIHKAEGSEWENIAIFMPDWRHRDDFLTNELFYTGVTRARRRLWLICSEAKLREVVANRLAPTIDVLRRLL
jgi:hypothetical protein